MATAGALEHQELMSEGQNLSLQRCASLKGLPSRRKQRENDRHHVAEKLQRRLPKFNQFSQNVVFEGQDYTTDTRDAPLSGSKPLRPRLLSLTTLLLIQNAILSRHELPALRCTRRLSEADTASL